MLFLHLITLSNTLGRAPLDEGSARRRDNTKHSQGTDIHAAGGIRTRNPSTRVAAHLRPLYDSTDGERGGVAVYVLGN
jgi:hypothetical protein